MTTRTRTEAAFEALVRDVGVMVDVGTPATLGPFGECWSNAWAVASAAPNRYQYAEGLYTAAEPFDADGHPHRATTYRHAFVIDRRTGLAAECTTGWAQPNVTYQAVPIAHHHAVVLFDELANIRAPLESFVEGCIHIGGRFTDRLAGALEDRTAWRALRTGPPGAAVLDRLPRFSL